MSEATARSAESTDGKCEPTGQEARNIASEKPRKIEYEVGYGRPPKKTRFKPGQSGNPKGRPAGRLSPKTIVNRVLNETVAVRKGETIRKMSTYEAVLLAHAGKAMKGDVRSANIIFNAAERAGVFAEPAADKLTPTSAEDLAILTDYLRRLLAVAEDPGITKEK